MDIMVIGIIAISLCGLFVLCFSSDPPRKITLQELQGKSYRQVHALMANLPRDYFPPIPGKWKPGEKTSFGKDMVKQIYDGKVILWKEYGKFEPNESYRGYIDFLEQMMRYNYSPQLMIQTSH